MVPTMTRLRGLLADHLGTDADRYDLAAMADDLYRVAGEVGDLGQVDGGALDDVVARHERHPAA